MSEQEDMQKFADWAAHADDEAGGAWNIGRAMPETPTSSERTLDAYARLLRRLTVLDGPQSEAEQLRLREMLELQDLRVRKLLATLGDSPADQALRDHCARFDAELAQLAGKLVALLGQSVRQWLPRGGSAGEHKLVLKAEATAVRIVLRARRLPLGAHDEELSNCSDPTLLAQWLARAATANSIDEVFLPTKVA